MTSQLHHNEIIYLRERILREAQQQQRRAQLDYEEKNKLIITMQNQLSEMQEFQQVNLYCMMGKRKVWRIHCYEHLASLTNG